MSSVADLIVRRLLDAGVSTLFGVPGGGSSLDLIDAAGRAGLRFVLTATETGGALAAVAQAETAHRPGACLTTLGPGVASVVNGVACAYLDRAPLIVLTDSYPATAGGASHQRLDHRALMAPVTKWSASLSGANADDVLTEAIALATKGRPGPVHIDVSTAGCISTVGRSPDADWDEAATVERSTDMSDPRSLDWRRFRRPLVLAGLGARGAGNAAAVRAFCSRHRVPAMVTYKAKGVVPDDDPHFGGVFTNGAIEQPVLNQADLLIGAGLDPVELLPGPWLHSQPFVSIDRWAPDASHLPAAARLVADVPDGLQQVSRRMVSTDWNLDAVRGIVAAQRELLRTTGERLTADRVVRTAAAAARDARVTVDAGAHMFAATTLWPIAEPGGMLISNGLSTMGFAVPAAIGASLSDRSRPVVALTGDGGLLICSGELLTAAREQLRVVTIVFSDASLSLIAVKQQQRRLPPAGVRIGSVDWCSLAESFGLAAHRASTEAELADAAALSLGRDGPSLIEARIDPSGYADTLRAVRG